MKLKKGLLIVGLLFVGAVNAQEGEKSEPESHDTRSVAPTPPPAPAIPKYKVLGDSNVVDFPDVEAQFPGGTEAMRKYIQDNVKYPEDARELGTQGRVYISFIVERDGSISAVEVMRGGVSQSINAEAKRLVREMPRWTPAEVKDQKVRARCRLPITFILESPEEKKPVKRY